MRTFHRALLGLLIFASTGGTLQAAILSADFQETLDLPYASTGPRILQKIGQILGPGFELADGDEVSNPDGFDDSLQVNFDGTTLTLRPTAVNTFQTITVKLSNIVFSVPGEQITGFSTLTSNAIIPNTGTFTQATSFTANSLTVSYTVDNIPSGNDFKFASSTATSTFAVSTAIVPEPAMLSLFGVGALLSCRRTRRRSA